MANNLGHFLRTASYRELGNVIDHDIDDEDEFVDDDSLAFDRPVWACADYGSVDHDWMECEACTEAYKDRQDTKTA